MVIAFYRSQESIMRDRLSKGCWNISFEYIKDFFEKYELLISIKHIQKVCFVFSIFLNIVYFVFLFYIFINKYEIWHTVIKLI